MFCVACCGRMMRMARGIRARSSRGQMPVRADGDRPSANANSSPLRNLLVDASAFGEAAPVSGELEWATQPYAAAAPGADEPPWVDPADTAVILFPGEGAEHVGMGRQLKDVPAARDLYALASEVLGWDVWRVCTQGPAEEVSRRAAVCVFVTALAALERAREERPAAVGRARAAAGYAGAGEVAALVFGGALALEAALRLLELRAAALAAAAADRRGAALTVWLSPAAELPHALLRAREHAAARGVPRPVCQVAAYLYPGCKVIAGDEEAVRWLEREGARFGVRRSEAAGAGGVAHCALAESTRTPLRAALAALELRAPRLRVMSGAEGAAYAGAAHVARGLARLGARPLRWEQTLHALFARPRPHALPLTLALGPAAALRHTLRHVNARAWDRSLQIDV